MLYALIGVALLISAHFGQLFTDLDFETLPSFHPCTPHVPLVERDVSQLPSCLALASTSSSAYASLIFIEDFAGYK